MLRMVAHANRGSIALAIVFTLALAPAAQAAFPGLNGKIAFQRNDALGGRDNIFTMDPNGSNLGALTSSTDVDSNAPAYSADGKRIAFVRDDPANGGIEHIWVMDANGANATQLTSDATHNDSHPAFSPDGTKIAFARDDATDSTVPVQIWVMDANGQNQHAITSDPNGAKSPAWSPDGTKIAFQRILCPEPACIPDEGSAIYVMGTDGSNQTKVSTGGAAGIGDNYPNWSPDGSKIAFSRDFPTGPEGEFIFVVGADGANETKLTTLSGTPEGIGQDDIQPAFSPDGTKIAFRREGLSIGEGPDSSFIMVMDANGQNQTQVTSGVVEDQKPDWQPLANVTSSATVPPCTTTGAVTVTVGDPSGFKSGPKAVHFQIDGGPEQTTPTNGSTATVTMPEGRHSLNFWGENQAGDQETTLHTVSVLVDRTRPRVTIVNDQRRATYRRGEFASVTIRATDAGGSLVRDPSRRHLRVSTARLGLFTVRATATDACGNTARALLRYRVVQAVVAHRRVVRPRFTG